jgi:hypothetical protein
VGRFGVPIAGQACSELVGRVNEPGITSFGREQDEPIDQIEHGHHAFRAYFKHAFLKQYEMFSTYLRNELCSNNLNDFGLKKGLDHLEVVRVGARDRLLTAFTHSPSFSLESISHQNSPSCSLQVGRVAPWPLKVEFQCSEREDKIRDPQEVLFP